MGAANSRSHGVCLGRFAYTGIRIATSAFSLLAMTARGGSACNIIGACTPSQSRLRRAGSLKGGAKATSAVRMCS